MGRGELWNYDASTLGVQPVTRCKLLTDMMPAEDEKINDASTELDELSSNGPSPLGSLSCSLQRAEAMLRTSLNPSLKWLLLQNRQDKESGGEEGRFVAAHNLVSRSSARVSCLQQGMLGMAAQRPLVRGADALEVCVRGSSPEGCFIQQRSSPPQQAACRALWSLMEQRSQLLFVHEYVRRAHSASAYVSKLALLEECLGGPQFPLNLKTCGSFSRQMVPLGQELRVHLKHWWCLSEKLRSNPFVRRALAPNTNFLVEMKRSLHALALQALVLMENCVHAILSSLAQTNIEAIAREMLEDVLSGTALYNQVVEEYSDLNSTNPWECRLLQRMCYSGLPVPQSVLHSVSHPAAFQVKELLSVLAIHHAHTAAEEMHRWAAEHYGPEVQSHHGNPRPSQARLCSRRSVTPEWTWERLEHTYLPPPGSPPLLPSPPSALIVTPSSGRSFSHSSQYSLSEGQSGCQSRAEPAPRRRHAGPQSALGSSVPESTLGQCAPGQRNPGGGPGVRVEPDLYPAACHCAVGPLSAFCKEDRFSLELLFQAMLSSGDRLSPLGPHTSRPDYVASASCPPVQRTREEGGAACRQMDSVVSHEYRTEVRPAPDWWLGQEPSSERVLQDPIEPGPSLGPESLARSGAVCPTALEEKEPFHRSRSVKWLDRSHSLVCAELFAVYQTLLWRACGQALWQNLHFPPGGAAGSLNLWSDHQKRRLLHTLRHASTTDLVPLECRAMLEKFGQCLLILNTHAHWDQVLCGSLGSALKDKCLPGTTGERPLLMTSQEQNGSLVMTSQAQGGSMVMTSQEQGGMTATVKHLLQLSPPLLSAVRCHLSAEATETGGGGPSSRALCRATVHLAVAAGQASLLWVMSKSHQFLSSWSLDKFLLITQGDLKVLRVSLERLLQQMETLMVEGAPHLYRHHRVLLRRQIVAVRSCVSELQAFSSVALKIFSCGCKQISGELFEQSMPSAKHWRLNYRTEFPSRPSEYMLFAAQSVIGQVLEGVAPLSDDARVQTLGITMTAFVEAWMEHILKHKIRFSVQGALQLKQDFDCIRGFLQSDEFSPSADLLHLRVFQQMDSAVICLLQQPQPKPYLQSRCWEPFRRCCPTTRSGSSIDVAIGASITNLENMEGEVLTHSSSSPLTPVAPPDPPLSPSQTYLAPSLALGAVQQEWLDLRIHNSVSRWRLPGLQCLSKSEH
ncbi:unnamed protein product [Boreogadus saida]